MVKYRICSYKTIQKSFFPLVTPPFSVGELFSRERVSKTLAKLLGLLTRVIILLKRSQLPFLLLLWVDIGELEGVKILGEEEEMLKIFKIDARESDFAEKQSRETGSQKRMLIIFRKTTHKLNLIFSLGFQLGKPLVGGLSISK